jgi:hypothetical protein
VPVVLAYLVCAIVWGTTWHVIRICTGPAGYPTVEAAALRFALAAVVLAPIVIAMRLGPWPRGRRAWAWIVVAGVLDAVSYALVYLGEERVPGGLAAVLFATQPLMLAALLTVTRAEPVRRTDRHVRGVACLDHPHLRDLGRTQPLRRLQRASSGRSNLTETGPPDRVCRSRSTCPPSAATTPTPDRAPRGRQGRRADQLARRLPRAVRRHPAREDEHVDDDQRHRHVAAGAVRGAGPRARRRRSPSCAARSRTTSIKEYLARGTYIFPPEHSLRLIAEMYEYCLEGCPSGTPRTSAVPPAGGRRDAGAGARLRAGQRHRAARPGSSPERGHFDAEQFARCVGRISFFVNSGIRFVEEMCKMRAFGGAVGRATPATATA